MRCLVTTLLHRTTPLLRFKSVSMAAAEPVLSERRHAPEAGSLDFDRWAEASTRPVCAAVERSPWCNGPKRSDTVQEPDPNERERGRGPEL